MKRLTRLPSIPLVPADATERLQKKFTAAKAEKVREEFWKRFQDSKQVPPVDFERLPV